MEEIVAIAAILLIIPGWAIGLVAIIAYLWRLFYKRKKVESIYDFYDDDQEMVTPPCPNCGLIDDVDYDLDWDQFSCTKADCPDDTF